MLHSYFVNYFFATFHYLPVKIGVNKCKSVHLFCEVHFLLWWFVAQDPSTRKKDIKVKIVVQDPCSLYWPYINPI